MCVLTWFKYDCASSPALEEQNVKFLYRFKMYVYMSSLKMQFSPCDAFVLVPRRNVFYI